MTTLTPRRSIGIRCSLGLWVATGMNIIAALVTLGAVVWGVSSFRTAVEMKNNQQDEAIRDIWTAVHSLEKYVYQHKD